MLRAWASLLATAGLCGGCIESFETPSAYVDEVGLCRPNNAALLAERVARCAEERAAGNSCDGIIGFEGIIDGEAVIVDTQIQIATIEMYREDTSNNGGWSAGDVKSVELAGIGPYFGFRFVFDDMGGCAPDVPETGERSYAFVAHASSDPTDTRARMEVLAAGARSGRAGGPGGALTLSTFGRTEMVGTFAGQYGPNAFDHLKGCFDASFSRQVLR